MSRWTRTMITQGCRRCLLDGGGAKMQTRTTALSTYEDTHNACVDDDQKQRTCDVNIDYGKDDS